MQSGGSLVVDRLRTPAWLLVGLTRSVSGELIACRGRLRFQAANVTLFDCPLATVRHVHVPWYYFGGGVHFTIEASPYRLSFVRPNSEGGSIFDISAGRRAGKAWKQILVQEPAVAREEGAD